MSRSACHEPTSLHAMSTGTTAARLVCSITAWSIDSDGASPNGSAIEAEEGEVLLAVAHGALAGARAWPGLMRDSSSR